MTEPRVFIEVPRGARRRIERAVESLISLLDEIDGDADLEPDADYEPEPGEESEQLSLL
jgi:hypothetical protein